MADIYFSEIHPNPEDGFEWIELYNNSNESISISRLKVYDQTSKNLRFTNTFFEPKTYITASASAILNNGGDTVILEKDGLILESVSYSAVAQGRSFTRCDNVWITDVVPTFGFNNICDEMSISPTAIATPSPLPSPTRTVPTLSLIKHIEHPLDFNLKHNNVSQKASPPAMMQTMITPQPQKSSNVPRSTLLLTIGFVSFIQCVFLVYLIIKRIRLDAPLSSHHNNE